MAAATSRESQLLGWEAFFDKIAVFLYESGRQFGNCSENFANYAIERLEICIITVSRLKAHLENGAVLVQPQYHEVVTGYKNSMESLVTYLRSLPVWRMGEIHSLNGTCIRIFAIQSCNKGKCR